MTEPTAHDADLYLRLLDIAERPHLVEARRWISGEFKATTYKEFEEQLARGSAERSHVVEQMAFYESAGVLVSRGLLHEDVFFDAPFGLDVLWPRLKPIVEEWQKAAKSQAAWENLYWLGLRYEAWSDERWKPKVELFPPERGPVKPEPHVTGFSR